MKKLLIILLLCSSAFAQSTAFKKQTSFKKQTWFKGVPVVGITIRQVATGTTPGGAGNGCGYASGTASCNVTFASPTTATDGIFVWEITNGTPNIPTMTGETFTAYTGTTGCQDFTGDFGQCWIATSIIGGQTSLTCSTSASTVTLLCIAFEFTRPSQLSTPNDAGGHTEQASATSLTVSTSAGSTNASDIVIGCFGSFGAAQADTYSIGAGFTLIANLIFGSAQSGQALCEYKLPGATGTQTATASFSGSAARSTNIVVAVKP